MKTIPTNASILTRGRAPHVEMPRPDHFAYFRCAGDMTKFFDPVSDEIHVVIQTGSHVMVHCKASLSRSPALVIAYLMKYHKLSLDKAGKLLKGKFDATWPCDRFAYDLVAYEKRLLG